MLGVGQTGCCCCCPADKGACVHQTSGGWVCEQLTPCECRSKTAGFSAGLFLGPGVACGSKTIRCATCHPCVPYPWRAGTCASDPLDPCPPDSMTMTVSNCRTEGMSAENSAAFQSIVGDYNFALNTSATPSLQYLYSDNTAGVPASGTLAYSCNNNPEAGGVGSFRPDISLVSVSLATPAIWPSGAATESVVFFARLDIVSIGSVCGLATFYGSYSLGNAGGPAAASVLYAVTIAGALP